MYISIQQNAFENVVWTMAAILSQPKCIDDDNIKNDVAHTGAS